MLNKKYLMIGLGLALIVLALSIKPSIPAAKAIETLPPLRPSPQQDGEQDKPTNSYCLLCHAEEGQVWELPSGETLPLTIDPTILAASVHGTNNPEGPVACADCHQDYRYPHPPNASQSVREFRLERYGSCRTCHEDKYLAAQDSTHGAALRAGQQDAAVCIDCHGGHDIQPPQEPRERISLTCGQCHGAIFETYRDSVHGKALLEENNPDVPTCTDCHGVHTIANPTTVSFRTHIPELCGDCHGDADLMAKYDISTAVLDTYLTDFHGSTQLLFAESDGEEAGSKAVCIDCHGTHNILAVEDGKAVRENLLATCRQCHPGASDNFPSAWVGHYDTSLEENPLLTLVTWFYKWLIPLGIGVFGLMIATNVLGGRIWGRGR